MREAGIENYKYIDWFRDHPIDDDLKLFRWSEQKLGGVAPTATGSLSTIHSSAGSRSAAWTASTPSANPPLALLEREIARFPKWLLWQALCSPKLELVHAGAQALGDGTWKVTLVVQNTGWLPTYVSKRALARKTVRGVVAEIGLPEGAQPRDRQAARRRRASSKARPTSTPACRSGRTTG